MLNFFWRAKNERAQVESVCVGTRGERETGWRDGTSAEDGDCLPQGFRRERDSVLARTCCSSEQTGMRLKRDTGREREREIGAQIVTPPCEQVHPAHLAREVKFWRVPSNLTPVSLSFLPWHSVCHCAGQVPTVPSAFPTRVY